MARVVVKKSRRLILTNNQERFHRISSQRHPTPPACRGRMDLHPCGPGAARLPWCSGRGWGLEAQHLLISGRRSIFSGQESSVSSLRQRATLRSHIPSPIVCIKASSPSYSGSGRAPPRLYSLEPNRGGPRLEGEKGVDAEGLVAER